MKIYWCGSLCLEDRKTKLSYLVLVKARHGVVGSSLHLYEYSHSILLLFLVLNYT